jgi:hypothetical protein
MSPNSWQELWNSLAIEGRPGEEQLPKPAQQAFAKFEKTTSFRLPESYKQFIAIFGPGELGGEYFFKSPGAAAPESMRI